MTDLIDFDAAKAERDQQPVRVKWGGVVYDLPPSLPLGFALDIVRLQEELHSKRDMSANELIRIGAGVWGVDEEAFRHIAVDLNHATIDDLRDVLIAVIRRYGGAPPVTGNPNRAARRDRAKTRKRKG